MKELWPAILASKAKAVVDKRPLPYLFNHYNLIPCYPTSANLARLAIGRMLNEFIANINDKDFLPRYIIIVPDKDIIESSRQAGFGCKVVFEKTLFWLMQQMETILSLRKEDIKGKKQGTLFAAESFPKIVWMTMSIRPFIKNADKGYVFAQCKTFNSILKAMIPKFDNTLLLETELPDDRNLFDFSGCITGYGKTLTWKEINRFIREMYEFKASKILDVPPFCEAPILQSQVTHGSRETRSPKDNVNYSKKTYFRDILLERAYHKF